MDSPLANKRNQQLQIITRLKLTSRLVARSWGERGGGGGGGGEEEGKEGGGDSRACELRANRNFRK